MNSVMSAYPFSGGPQSGVSSQYNPRSPVAAAYMAGPGHHNMHHHAAAHRQSFAIQELLGLGNQAPGTPGLFHHHESSPMAYTYPNFVGTPTPTPTSSAAATLAAASMMGDGDLGGGAPGGMMGYCGGSNPWRSGAGTGAPTGFLPTLGSMQGREEMKYGGGSSSDPLSSPDGKGLLGPHGGKRGRERGRTRGRKREEEMEKQRGKSKEVKIVRESVERKREIDKYTERVFNYS
jgi:hypothetical protein